MYTTWIQKAGISIINLQVDSR